MLNRTLALAAIVGACFSCARADPPEAVAKEGVALSFTAPPASREDINGPSSRAAREFSLTLQRLASTTTPEQQSRAAAQEGESIEYKLAAIAIDRSQRPEVYEEIDRYVRRVDMRTRSQAMGPLAPRYAAERYRLPWEYYLLSPEPSDVAPMYWLRAAEAVGAIRNPQSLITLLHVIRVASTTDTRMAHGVARARCQVALGAMAEIDHAALAQFLADGLAIIDSVPAERRPVTRDESIRQISKLISVLPQKKRDAWRSVLRDGAASGRPEVRRLAQEIQSATPFNPRR